LTGSAQSIATPCANPRWRARSAAGDRDVTVLGGADILRQLLAAGLVDELRIHLAHMLLGGGTRLFDRPMSGWDHLELRRTSVTPTAAATHFTFTVKRLATT
jgi:dihydrofolate reductase